MPKTHHQHLRKRKLAWLTFVDVHFRYSGFCICVVSFEFGSTLLGRRTVSCSDRGITVGKVKQLRVSRNPFLLHHP